MSNQQFNTRRGLKRLGEDTAYTFKGLMKTADWYDLIYNGLVLIPLAFGLVSLGFDIPKAWDKAIAIISILASIFLLAEGDLLKRAEKYRDLGNRYKELYDEIEHAYYDVECIKNNVFIARSAALRSETSKLPIAPVGRWLAKKNIFKEMDLKWLSEDEVI